MSRIVLFLLSVMVYWGSANATSPVHHEYQFPVIPDSIVVPAERAAFLVRHFWSNSPIEAMVELQTMQTFFYALSKVPYTIKKEAVAITIDKASTDVDILSVVAYYIDCFIGSPESEYCDDELYLESQRLIISSPVPDEYKIAPRWRVGLLSKNPIGSKAPNVPFYDTDGNASDLYSQVMPCVVVFANSECLQCHEELTQFSAELGQMRQLGWNVIVVYLDGIIPVYAVEAKSVLLYADVDNYILENDVYVVRRLPSVYLLDSEIRILVNELRLRDVVEAVR